MWWLTKVACVLAVTLVTFPETASHNLFWLPPPYGPPVDVTGLFLANTAGALGNITGTLGHGIRGVFENTPLAPVANVVGGVGDATNQIGFHLSELLNAIRLGAASTLDTVIDRNVRAVLRVANLEFLLYPQMMLYDLLNQTIVKAPLAVQQAANVLIRNLTTCLGGLMNCDKKTLLNSENNIDLEGLFRAIESSFTSLVFMASANNGVETAARLVDFLTVNFAGTLRRTIEKSKTLQEVRPIVAGIIGGGYIGLTSAAYLVTQTPERIQNPHQLELFVKYLKCNASRAIESSIAKITIRQLNGTLRIPNQTVKDLYKTLTCTQSLRQPLSDELMCRSVSPLSRHMKCLIQGTFVLLRIIGDIHDSGRYSMIVEQSSIIMSIMLGFLISMLADMMHFVATSPRGGFDRKGELCNVFYIIAWLFEYYGRHMKPPMPDIDLMIDQLSKATMSMRKKYCGDIWLMKSLDLMDDGC